MDCGVAYLRWIRAEQGAHTSLMRGQRKRHVKYEKLSTKLFNQAAKRGCKWAR
jgi:hypothetical protein